MRSDDVAGESGGGGDGGVGGAVAVAVARNNERAGECAETMILGETREAIVCCWVWQHPQQHRTVCLAANEWLDRAVAVVLLQLAVDLWKLLE